MIRRSVLILFLLLFVGLALAFIFPYRQLIKDTLAEPINYSVWYVQKLWKSMDSDIIWGTFILIIYVLILMTFPPFRNISPKPVQAIMVNQGSRLEFWLYEVRRLLRRQEFSRFSVIELKKLVLDVIAFREQFATRYEAEQWLMTHEQDVPSQVAALFDRKAFSEADQPGKRGLQRWWRLCPWKALRPDPRHQNEESMKVIIQFLENQFEMRHDQDYR